MSENIYKETILGNNNGPKLPINKIFIQLDRVEIDGFTRFILFADVISFMSPRDDEGETIYELEYLHPRYTSREKALRHTISMADDLKKRYENATVSKNENDR